MKLLGVFLAFAAVAAQKGALNADEKGAQTCLGVQVESPDFMCKHKKKKAGNRKRCKLTCKGATMKKIFCNEDGWGGKAGKPVDVKKLC